MITEEKERVRNLIWSTLENNNLSQHTKSPYGRIPDFSGSTEAARMLRSTEEWQNAEVIFSSPDTAQIKVREFALLDKKLLIMASPKLKDGFILIDPFSIKGDEKTASTIKGAFKFGKKIHELTKLRFVLRNQRFREFPQVDLVVEGSVAVDKSGNRLGKGGGYGDREISELISEKAITQSTPVVTTVHEIQIIDKVPTEEHDQKINMIITSERVIRII
ncbi:MULTISPECIES: 5-formyltetrahydrofolate cyclo-ligase [Methanobacterium]|uniref:5-formyltetrahydrofolate cyclo-ligase n=1 Tax=Methanobacterium bryantii TaxID=2161 RepID=A0A2A2H8H5_METBR|nr:MULTISPECIES: 5-formyltetrahydrofolate cyclo-ligase [Methanobacterium]OEC84459.1 5-formyltetrahydrofolate cyclo-ligase [Methanobacterium sp. A39]PAV05570.1 5-formyltetrahydrofolate cyclo-ligase [Methanobacterium bryantii]